MTDWFKRALSGAFRLFSYVLPRRIRQESSAEMLRDMNGVLEARLRQRGWPAAASYALRAIVDVTRVGLKERVRVRRDDASPRARGGGSLRELWTDLRHGGRRLRRAPGFALAAVLLLALGIGANTTVFSALKLVLLSAPPYPDAGRLVWISLMTVEPTRRDTLPWSWAKYGVLEEGAPAALESVAAYGTRTLTLSGEGRDPQRFGVEVVTAGYFETLRTQPTLGRAFTREETDDPEAPAVVILGHGLWQDRYGGDSGVIGRTITLNDVPVQVVGVAARGFEGLSGGARAWVPVPTGGRLISRFMLSSPHSHWLWAIGRLAPDLTAKSAEVRLATVATAIGETYPVPSKGNQVIGEPGIAVRPLADARRNAESRAAVLVLMVASAMVLLIACANLAGLLLARSRGFSRDAAVRLALGAGRFRVMRAALAESMLLALAGGAGALAIAYWGVAGLRGIWPDRFTSPSGPLGGVPLESMDLNGLRLDGGALAFAFGVSLLTGLLFGLLPAIRRANVGVQQALREGTGATRRRARRRGGPATTSILVAVQTGLALTLLVGAGLMLGTLLRLRAVDAGFETSNLLVMSVTLSRSSPSWQNPAPLIDEVLTRVSSVPGVQSATIGCAPLNGHCWIGGIRGIDGREEELEGVSIGIHSAPDRFFETLRIPVIYGRTFGRDDRAGSPPVVVLNESAARRIFGAVNVVGRRLAVTADVTTDAQAEVIGVVGDVLQGRLNAEPMPEAYFSSRQLPEPGGALIVRTTGEPLDRVTAVRTAVRAVDPTIIVDRVRTMESARGVWLSETRIVLALLGLYATLALLLAAAGIWAVVAMSVAERRAEIGLRMALGADSRQLVRMVARDGIGATAAGLVFGGWAAWGLARLLSSLLFEIGAHDVRVYAAAALVLLAGAIVAGLVPARQATRVDPARSLRAE